MNRETGHVHAGSRRRVRTDTSCRTTRRKLLLALGAAALASPLTPHAQPQTKVWRVGLLSLSSGLASLDSDPARAFPQAMRELGYIEGKNLVIEWRFADGKNELLPNMAAELVRLKMDAIVTQNQTVTLAAQKATATIPIVMANSGDPVGSGFVKSLAHPSGNITGLSNMVAEISAKHLEMLLSMVPNLSRVAVLVNPANSTTAATLTSVQAAAQKVRVNILPVEVRTVAEIEKAFAAMAREKAGAVIVARDALFLLQARHTAELAVKNRLPTIFGLSENVEAGGLMSYGASATDNYRRAATFVDKIFKGAKPGDLPVEQPTKFELIINGKTAKALGLKIPQSLLIIADKVIE